MLVSKQNVMYWRRDIGERDNKFADADKLSPESIRRTWTGLIALPSTELIRTSTNSILNIRKESGGMASAA